MSYARWFPSTACWNCGITCYPFHVHWNVTNVTFLSSRWLSMNSASACTDAQPSPALQCPHSHTFLLQISAEWNFKHKFKLNWEKLGGEILHMCEEVEKRKRGRGKGEEAYKVLFWSFHMLAVLKARAALLSLLTKWDAGTMWRRKGES